jgi:hypothetical protein
LSVTAASAAARPGIEVGMIASIPRLRTRLLGAVVALASAMAPAAELCAQQRSLTGTLPGAAGSDAYLQRQLRSLEAGGTSLESMNIQLRRAQRDLITQSRGVAFTPEQARIDRGLDRVGRELHRQQINALTAQQPALPRGERLPGSIDDRAPLPSFGGTPTLGRLVGRAETALTEGRRDQARSDVATARSLVDAVDSSSAEARRALTDLEARMTAIEAQLGGGG